MSNEINIVYKIQILINVDLFINYPLMIKINTNLTLKIKEIIFFKIKIVLILNCTFLTHLNSTKFFIRKPVARASWNLYFMPFTAYTWAVIFLFLIFTG